MASASLSSAHTVSSAKVFVSYAREDQEFARQLFMALEDRGFGPLMDVRAIVPGEPWQLRLTNLIDQCDSVVVVLSDAYLASDACGWEIGEAEKRGKRMISVLPQALTSGERVPPVLAKDQYIFFYAEPAIPDSGFYDGVRKLDDGLRQDLRWLRLRRLYEQRAEDWGGRADDILLTGSSLEEATAWEATPPEKQSVPEGVAAFLKASRAKEEQARRKARAFRRRSIAVFVFGALLAVGTAVLWFLYRDTAVELRTATQARRQIEQDSATLQRDIGHMNAASTAWSNGRVDLESYRAARIADGRAQQEFAIGGGPGQAVKFLREADGEIQQISPHGRTSQAALIWKVGRDYARALYYGSEASTTQPLDAIISETRDGSEVIQLSKDYVARAVYTCKDPQRRARIAADLAEAPQAARAVMSWDYVTAEDNAAGVCAEAKAAVCAIAADCSGATGPASASVPVPAPEVASGAGAAPGKADQPKAAPAPPPPSPISSEAQKAFQITEIFLHLVDPADRPKAEQMKQALESLQVDGRQKYRVLGIQMVDGTSEKNRSVRYYYSPQAAQAKDLVDDCQRAAAGLGFASWSTGYRLISLAGRYDSLPPHRAEVWF